MTMQVALTTILFCWTCAAREPMEAELKKFWKPVPLLVIRTPVQVV